MGMTSGGRGMKKAEISIKIELRMQELEMSGKKKQEVISFKADESLNKALEGIENRSAFIRAAILSALDSVCPLCKGSGILTSEQRRHWDAFTENHPLEQCEECEAVHLVCVAGQINGTAV